MSDAYPGGDGSSRISRAERDIQAIFASLDTWRVEERAVQAQILEAIGKLQQEIRSTYFSREDYDMFTALDNRVRDAADLQEHNWREEGDKAINKRLDDMATTQRNCWIAVVTVSFTTLAMLIGPLLANALTASHP